MNHLKFVLCQVSVVNSCPKRHGKSTPIQKVHSSDNGIIQLNQKNTNLTFYNKQVNSLFGEMELPLEGPNLDQNIDATFKLS